MTIVKHLAIAAATLAAILLLAIVSDAALEIALLNREARTVVRTGSPCVDAKGAWVNWPWPNVPTLAPPCPDVTAGPAETK